MEETLLPGASVSRVARRYDVNANQGVLLAEAVSRRRLGSRTDAQLVPVKVANGRSIEAVKEDDFLLRSGTLEIKLAKGTLRVAGVVDVVVLRTAITARRAPCLLSRIRENARPIKH